jgi:hypothetical protein
MEILLSFLGSTPHCMCSSLHRLSCCILCVLESLLREGLRSITHVLIPGEQCTEVVRIDIQRGIGELLESLLLPSADLVLRKQ